MEKDKGVYLVLGEVVDWLTELDFDNLMKVKVFVGDLLFEK